MVAFATMLAARKGCQTRPNPPTHHHLPPRPSESAAVPHRVRSMSSPRLVDVDLIRDLLEPLGDSAQCATPLTWDYLRLMSTPNHRRHFGALGATASGIKVSSGGREASFDHLVGDGEQRRRHLDAERPGRCGSEQPGIWKRFQMPAKNVCDKPKMPFPRWQWTSS